MNTELPGRKSFEAAYTSRPPWDIGRPQTDILAIADSIQGSVIDVGCGTGENAIHLARHGRSVLGIDFLEAPIAMANEKLSKLRDEIRDDCEVVFRQFDALELAQLGQQFDAILDCGLYHVFSNEDRARYLESLASCAKPNTLLTLHCFSEFEPPGFGPRRVPRSELEETFSKRWQLELIREARYEIRTDFKHFQFSEGGAKAWLMQARFVG